MRFDVVYIVQGKPELRELLTRKVDADFAEVLCEVSCIQNSEGGRTMWKASDHLLTIKLLFLAALSDWDVFETEDGIRAIFETSARDETLFDKWWTIQRAEISATSSDLESRFGSQLGNMPPSANPLVNSWMDFCINKAITAPTVSN